MNATGMEQIGVTAAALEVGSVRRQGHLPVVDGQIREIVNLDHVADSVWILHAADDDAPLDELTVGRDWLVPCVRVADWAAAMDAAAGAR